MTRKVQENPDLLLLPAEVGQLFRVSPKTVTRWVFQGKIGSVRTLGGHHRFHVQEVRRLLVANYTGRTGLAERLAYLDNLIGHKNIAAQ